MSLQYSRRAEDSETGKYKIVLNALSPANHVLEIGCSTGYFLEVLRKHGFKVKGCEFDRDSVAVARKKGLDVNWANAEDPNSFQTEDKFDAVLLLDVLEHLREPEKTLTLIKKVLTPNGRIFVTVPNIAYWAVRKDLLFGRWQYVDAGILDRTHLRFYNLSGWRDLFENSHFRVNKIHVADAMICGEGRLKKIPGLSRWVDSLKKILVKAFPKLFAISFFFELEPQVQN